MKEMWSCFPRIKCRPMEWWAFYFQVIWLCQAITGRRSRRQSQGDYVFSINFNVQQWRQYLPSTSIWLLSAKSSSKSQFSFRIIVFCFLRIASVTRLCTSPLWTSTPTAPTCYWHTALTSQPEPKGAPQVWSKLNFYSSCFSKLFVDDWHDKFRN